MRPRIALFVLFALAAAALFARLGLWQLHRLDERRERNALVRRSLQAPPVPFAALPRDPARARLRRVRVAGAPDWSHELIVAARTHDGSPGVHLLTPVRVPGSDTAVLVNRGWVYSPDGLSVDLARWHEPDSVWTGFAEPFDGEGGLPAGRGPATLGSRERTLRWMSRRTIDSMLPYPVAPMVVVALDDSGAAPRPDRPARLGVPPLDEGPHMSYAIQWFAFAVIAIVGAAMVAFRSARGEDDEVPPRDRADLDAPGAPPR